MRDETEALLSMPYSNSMEMVHSPRYQWDCFDRGNVPFVILQFTLKGRGCFSTRGRTHDVPAGSAFVSLVPEQARYFYPPDAREPWAFSWLNFYGALSLDLWGRLRERFGPVIQLPLRSAAGMQLVSLAKRVAERKFADRYEASAEAYAFYTNCWREAAQPRREQADPVAAVLQFCRDHFRDPVSVKELAAQSNLSREHFSRVFKESQGVSPAAYLRKQRLLAAAEMLRSTSLPIKEVALRTGFYSARHLMKSFARVRGETPQQYRRRKARRGKLHA